MFWRSLQVQLRVIGALLIREIHTRFGRENLGFGWVIAEPLVFAIPVLLVWHTLRPPFDAGLPMVPFLWTGYMPLLLFRHLGGRVLMFMRVNVGLMYHRQVTVFDLFAARAVLETASNFFALVVSFGFFWVTGMINWPRDLPMFFLGYFFLTWWAIAVCTIVGGLSERGDIVEKVWQPISYLYMAVSGFFFLSDWLPPRLRDWAIYAMPSMQGYDILREGLFGPSVPVHANPGYLCFVFTLLTIMGLMFIRDAKKYLELE